MREARSSHRRRAFLCGLPWLLLPLSARVRAVRVSDVPLYATLRQAMFGRTGDRACAVAAGSTVELVAEVAGPGVPAGAERRWFVRVVGGPCDGAELTVPDSALRDPRSQAAPP